MLSAAKQFAALLLASGVMIASPASSQTTSPPPTSSTICLPRPVVQALADSVRQYEALKGLARGWAETERQQRAVDVVRTRQTLLLRARADSSGVEAARANAQVLVVARDRDSWKGKAQRRGKVVGAGVLLLTLLLGGAVLLH